MGQTEVDTDAEAKAIVGIKVCFERLLESGAVRAEQHEGTSGLTATIDFPGDGEDIEGRERLLSVEHYFRSEAEAGGILATLLVVLGQLYSHAFIEQCLAIYLEGSGVMQQGLIGMLVPPHGEDEDDEEEQQEEAVRGKRLLRGPLPQPKGGPLSRTAAGQMRPLRETHD